MQPDWLTKGQARVQRISFGLVNGLLKGLMTGLGWDMTVVFVTGNASLSLKFGLGFGSYFSLLEFLAESAKRQILPVEAFHWS